MNWYYVENGQRVGPVQDLELSGLVMQGVITEATLVWHEGMANWQPYQEVAAPAAVPVATAVAPAIGLNLAGAVCSRCGRPFPVDQLIHIGGGNVCPDCKPLALQSLQEGVLHHDSNAEQIRKEHISHEASVKSIGLLYYLGGAMILLAGLTGFFGDATQVAAGAALLFMGIGMIWTASGLRKLRPWARIVSGVMAGLGLLGFPLGTLINGYILYLLFSKKGKMVFSEPYQRVIAATPHIKYKTSIIVWIFLGLLLLLLALGIVGILMSGFSN